MRWTAEVPEHLQEDGRAVEVLLAGELCTVAELYEVPS